MRVFTTGGLPGHGSWIPHLYGLTHTEFAHVLEASARVPRATRDAFLAASDWLVEIGEAASLNPDCAADRAALEAKTATVRGSASEPEAELRALVAGGESATLEFTSSARVDLRTGKRNRRGLAPAFPRFPRPSAGA